VFIARAFFLLIGIEAIVRILMGTVPDNALAGDYPVIAYLGLAIAVILIDNRAIIADRRRYLAMGAQEIAGIVAVLAMGTLLAATIRPLVALPPIFFVMLQAAALGALLPARRLGPALRCLLFAGIPVVLAANFVVGGSRIGEALTLEGMHTVLAYGFFGQIMWMFGGIALLMLVGRTTSVAALGPGMAGALSHAGLTGACTAGDLGDVAARRAPIMINVPFFGHVFVFSIMAVSLDQGRLAVAAALAVAFVGLLLTARALIGLARAHGDEGREVGSLMQFSFGWQLSAVFGGLLLLSAAGVPIEETLMATASALSHFGLFAAVQGGMAGAPAAALIAFVFAMPFLVHPFVFFLFGRAMVRGGEMPRLPTFVLAGVGVAGVAWALLRAGAP
jgi:hypothetical protein